MWTLFKKEFRSFFGAPTGFLIIGLFITATGLTLWLIPNPYNIIDSGYASLEGLFILAPWLFLFLVPAVTMRSFAEEKKTGTIELLLTKPIRKFHIILGKYYATVALSLVGVMLTLCYFLSIYLMGETPGNLDVGSSIGSYIGLCFLVAIYASIGIFASSCSSNQIVAFIVGTILCFILFYGFELLASLFPDGNMQLFLENQGIYAHYESISRGVINLEDLFYFIKISFLFILLTWLSLSAKQWQTKKLKALRIPLVAILLIGVGEILFSTFFIRYDLTAEKRYSLSQNSRQLLRELSEKEDYFQVNIFLEGDLNPGFRRLQQSLIRTLEDFQVYSNHHFKIKFINPSQLFSQESGKALSEILEERGLNGINVSERNKQNALVQKIVYPWMEIIYQDQSRDVLLLRDDPAKSGHEDINIAIQELEYQLMDAIRQLTNKTIRKIAFLEGHNEFHQLEVEDLCYDLSKYYQIDRGQLGTSPEELNPYEVVIVAGASQPFSLKEKYILDQYLMGGGKILFLLDGAQISLDSLQSNPVTISFPNVLNLKDQLFHYGVRINNDLIESAQCANMYLDVAQPGQTANYQLVPWYFYPTLFTSPHHVITKNVNPVKSFFSSSLNFVGNNKDLKKTVLLTSSPLSRLHQSPSIVNFEMSMKGIDTSYFSSGSQLTGALLEGKFNSAFKLRPRPSGIETHQDFLDESKDTKMIVISSSSIIRNELKQQGTEFTPLPLGYDQVTRFTYGNKDFLLNAINYLCDNQGWLNLRAKEISIRLLSKQEINLRASFWSSLNLIAPLVGLLILHLIIVYFRKKRK